MASEQGPGCAALLEMVPGEPLGTPPWERERDWRGKPS